MNSRIEAMARLWCKRELRKIGYDNKKLRDMHDTEQLIKLVDKERRYRFKLLSLWRSKKR